MNFKECAQALREIGISLSFNYEPEEFTIEQFEAAMDVLCLEWFVETTRTQNEVDCKVTITDGLDGLAIGQYACKTRDIAEHNAICEAIKNFFCYLY